MSCIQFRYSDMQFHPFIEKKSESLGGSDFFRNCVRIRRISLYKPTSVVRPKMLFLLSLLSF